MKLVDKIDQDLKIFLKEKNTSKTTTLRVLKSSLKNLAIENKKPEGELTDEEVISVVKKELKKRQDAIEAYQKANRADLFEKEEEEAEILSVYMPQMLSEDEISKIVDEVIAAGPENFGLAMKEVMAKTKGQADGKIVQQLVKQKLDS